jgi:hypothetical protein
VTNQTQESTSIYSPAGDTFETPSTNGGFQLNSLYAVAFRSRTYSRIFYLLIGLPLSLFVTTFTLTALVLSIALAPVGIGLIVLGGLATGVWILFGIEREAAILLLRTDIKPIVTPKSDSDDAVSMVKAHLKSPRTWLTILYLIGRFPVGAISFVVTVSALGVASMVTAAPLLINLTDIDLGFWLVEELWEALILALIGPPLALAALHLVNAVALVNSGLINLIIEPEPHPLTPEQMTHQ